MTERASILIVEDEAITAMELEDRLTNMGYTVVGVVSNGEDAIKKAGEMKPDLVLMDIMIMGDLDGIDTAEIIRKDFAIPIIYLTAYSDESILKRAKVTGPYGYIIKPFGQRELYANIEMTLHRNELEIAMKESRERAEFFLDLMGHDLSNINQAICGTLEFLLFDETLSDRVVDVINEALSQVNRGSQLITNVRKFKRIDEDPPELRSIDLFGALSSAVEVVQNDIPDKTTVLKTNLKPGSYSVMADEYLTDVFYIFLHNAMRFDPKDSVEIEIEVDVSEDEKNLSIQFIDCGKGIPDDSKNLVFARISLKDSGYLGSGIGLTLLKHIIDH